MKLAEKPNENLTLHNSILRQILTMNTLVFAAKFCYLLKYLTYFLSQVLAFFGLQSKCTVISTRVCSCHTCALRNVWHLTHAIRITFIIEAMTPVNNHPNYCKWSCSERSACHARSPFGHRIGTPHSHNDNDNA